MNAMDGKQSADSSPTCLCPHHRQRIIETGMPRKRIGQAADANQVDKKAKREESNMQMDDMAIEWVEQVLSFLPLTEVYKCRSVCKKWQAAADYVISDWETLTVACEWGSNCADAHLKNRILLNKAAVSVNRQARARSMIWHRRQTETDATWIKRLKQLVRLKEIFVTDNCEGHLESKLVAVVNDVVLRNSATLTLLHMRWMPLRLNPNHAVVFRNLRDLDCRYLVDPDRVAALPRLVKLRTSTSIKVLQKLPAETMTSLHIDLELETKSHVEIEQLVAACSRLMQLKSIYLDFGYAFFQDEFTDLHDGAFSKLFTNMKKLEEVDILFPMFEEVNVDAAIKTLVHNSASVSSIRMRDGRMTDASLHSLSRLTGLQLLAIRSSGRHSDITTEGILSLLRGGSRKVLRELAMDVSVLPDFEQIRAEVQLMQQETGRSLFVDSSSPTDVLYNFRIAVRD